MCQDAATHYHRGEHVGDRRFQWVVRHWRSLSGAEQIRKATVRKCLSARTRAQAALTNPDDKALLQQVSCFADGVI